MMTTGEFTPLMNILEIISTTQKWFNTRLRWIASTATLKQITTPNGRSRQLTTSHHILKTTGEIFAP